MLREPGDDDFLVGPYDIHPDARVVRADQSFTSCDVPVFFVVEIYPQVAETPAYSPPDIRSVFSDAAGEGENIQSLQDGGEGPDILPRPVNEGLDSQSGIGISFFSRLPIFQMVF